MVEAETVMEVEVESVKKVEVELVKAFLVKVVLVNRGGGGGESGDHNYPPRYEKKT
jgi:hypothetical protein